MKREKFRIRTAPVLVVYLAMLFLTGGAGAVLELLPAVALHEAGHLAAARLLKIPLRGIRLDLLGARLETGERLLSYKEEWLLAAAGPMASLCSSAVLFPFALSRGVGMTFCSYSFLFGVLNLLPIRTFDGGRMTEAAVSALFGVRAGGEAMRISSMLFLFLLWFCAVYFLLRTGNGFSLFCFSMTLLGRALSRDG